MCTIADAKVRQNYNCYNVYFNECLLRRIQILVKIDGAKACHYSFLNRLYLQYLSTLLIK